MCSVTIQPDRLFGEPLDRTTGGAERLLSPPAVLPGAEQPPSSMQELGGEAARLERALHCSLI